MQKETLSVSEIELLGFFGVIPTQPEPDDPWAYTDSKYEVADDCVRLLFAINPYRKDVWVLVQTRGTTIYELNAVGVEDIKHHHEKGRELLEVIVSGQDSIWIRVKPEIQINQFATERT